MVTGYDRRTALLSEHHPTLGLMVAGLYDCAPWRILFEWTLTSAWASLHKFCNQAQFIGQHSSGHSTPMWHWHPPFLTSATQVKPHSDKRRCRGSNRRDDFITQTARFTGFETKNKEVEKKTYNTPHKMQGWNTATVHLTLIRAMSLIYSARDWWRSCLQFRFWLWLLTQISRFSA